MLEPIILARLRERDCRDKGWVMDSWPRTAQQAQRLVDESLMPQIAVVLQVEDGLIEDRVSMRLENPSTGRLYHYMHDPPPLGEQVLRGPLTLDPTPQALNWRQMSCCHGVAAQTLRALPMPNTAQH